MEQVARKPEGSWDARSVVVIAVLATVAIWMFSPTSRVALALIAIAALFLLGLKRPVWAMAALVVSQLSVSSYNISTPLGFAISLRLLLLLILAVLIWHASKRVPIDLGPRAKHILIPTAILTGVSLTSNLMNSGLDNAFKDFRNMLVGLLFVLLIAATVKNLKDLKLLSAVAFIGVTASSVIAILQHFQLLGGSGALLGKSLAPGRASGMAESQLELSFTLPIAMLAILGVYLASGVKSSMRLLLAASVPSIGLAIYFTYTRSAIFAVLLGLVALALFLKTSIKGEYVLAALLVLIGYLSMSGVSESKLGNRSGQEQDESLLARKIVWQAGLAIAVDNPILGIGGDRFKIVSPRYASRVDPSLMRLERQKFWSYRSLGSVEPHNDFLMLLVSYGAVALIAYVWLFFVVLRNFLDCFFWSKSRFIKGLSLGLAAALLSYAANAFYHNLLSTLPLLWIHAGFALAITKMAFKRGELPDKGVRNVKC